MDTFRRRCQVETEDAKFYVGANKGFPFQSLEVIIASRALSTAEEFGLIFAFAAKASFNIFLPIVSANIVCDKP